MVAEETREGDVYLTLLKKLEAEREALGGAVSDVLGKAIGSIELRKLMIQAIRYGDRPEVRAKLTQQVEEAKEAKQSYPFDKLVKYCAALANEGGGKVILGVTDRRPRRIVGTRAFTQPERTRAGLIEKSGNSALARLDQEQLLQDAEAVAGENITYAALILFGTYKALGRHLAQSNEEVLQKARDKIWQSWRYTCAENVDHPIAKELFDRYKLPAFHDPFAGGGALPLEAQRLGLEAYASDLNPVAVLINKAMIEIPPKFAGMPPVNPEARKDKRLFQKTWKGTQGLAEDVRYYGKWMRGEAEKRIGHLYPKVEVAADMARARLDLKKYVGQELTVIAWLWARTVKSPNEGTYLVRIKGFAFC